MIMCYYNVQSVFFLMLFENAFQYECLTIIAFDVDKIPGITYLYDTLCLGFCKMHYAWDFNI